MKCYLPVLLLTHSLPILLHFHTTASQQEREREGDRVVVILSRHVNMEFHILVWYFRCTMYDVYPWSVLRISYIYSFAQWTVWGWGEVWRWKTRCGIFLCAFFPHSIQHTRCFFHFIFCRMYISWRELCEKHDMCASIMEWIGHRHSFHV